MKKLLIGTAVVATLDSLSHSPRVQAVWIRGASSQQTTTYGNFELGPIPEPCRTRRCRKHRGNLACGLYERRALRRGRAFIQWHSDGTEWENINHPVLGGNICMGSWRAVRSVACLSEPRRLVVQRWS